MMRSSPPLLLLLCAALLTSTSAHAQGSKEGKKRESLLEQLGLEKSEKKKPSEEPPPEGDEPPSPETEPGAADAERDDDDDEPAAEDKPNKRRAAVVAFAPRVHALLVAECKSCHRPGKRAAKSGFVLVGEAQADYESARRFVGRAPDKSPLFLEASGVDHGGDEVLARGSEGSRLLSSWIAAGAPFGGKSAAAEPSAATPPAVTAPTTSGPAHKGPTTTTEAPAAPPAAPEPATSAPSPAPLAADTAEPLPLREQPSGPSFAADVHPLLVERCAACHEPDGMAGESAYRLSESAAAHYDAVRSLVDPASPSSSLLFARALGDEHRAVLATGSAEAALLLSWIEAGALGPPALPATTTTGDVSEEAPPASGAQQGEAQGVPPRGQEPLLSPQPLLELAQGAAPWLAGIRLHGRFDVSYERRGYTDDPLSDDATDALQSYHHFLFLSRRSPNDPIGVDVELLTLQFWELSARHSYAGIHMGAKLGKLLVPFGADPLYHHSYGGLAGFDQRILPIVWAQEGASVFANAHVLGVGLSVDAFLLRGFGLRSEDAVLNLQGDISPLDDVKLAGGGRLRASYGPLSLFYSALVNPLGFDRLLYLQALDVSLWRWRGIPFVEDLALSLGVLRGDVSGGGAGSDHYHFGSYLQARYYAWDFLYFQYRQGLRTFDNQRGLYEDPYRFTSDDASTHSVGAVVQWRGVQAGLFHHWNLEKVDEIDDDFLRFTVGYAF